MSPPEVRRAAPRPRSSVSRAQIETVTARAVGLFGLVFGAQTIPVVLAQAPDLYAAASATMVAVVYAGILALALASIVKKGVRLVATLFAAAYALALVLWPFAVSDAAGLSGQAPWLYFLCTVATTAACVAFSLVGAVAYASVVPVMYGIVRVLPEGGGVSPLLAVLDALYAFILGIMVIIIITMLRQASAAVDGAQEAALRRYDLAVRQHASEVERVRVDALVHDSVLTTLLSAAAASTPDEKALAARMAKDAISRLDAAGAPAPGLVETAPLAVLVRRIRASVSTFSAPFQITVDQIDRIELPVDALEALYSAAVQAMVNSMQHAGEGTVRRALTVRGDRRGGCLVQISDTGRGFDVETVPSGRLGLRVSIEERVASAGGTARIDSRPGGGTTVALLWPAEETRS